MASFNLLVIADPAASFMKALSALPQDMNVVISDDVGKLIQAAPDADAILFAHGNAGLLTKILPVAKRVRCIHCLWTGVKGNLNSDLLENTVLLHKG